MNIEATTLKCTVIKDKSQYDQYCRQLEELLEGEHNEAIQDEIDLLTLLVEKYDEELAPSKEAYVQKL